MPEATDDLLAMAASYRAVGITEIVLILRTQEPAHMARRIGDLLPRLRAVG